jgi:hypothetical protein
VAPQRSTAYGRSALRRGLDTLSGAGEGSRNHTLNRSAFILGQLVGGGALDETETADALLQTGVDTGLGKRECQATMASGMSAGMANPRSLSVSDQVRRCSPQQYDDALPQAQEDDDHIGGLPQHARNQRGAGEDFGVGVLALRDVRVRRGAQAAEQQQQHQPGRERCLRSLATRRALHNQGSRP